ncbi:MAG: hypothetical protein OXB94_13100 [Nitrospira sp.]|nr:hypothetical protein [Nitrospira sp.]
MPMNTRLWILPVAFLGTLLLSGCLGPPRIETAVYEGPNGSIMLKTVSDASYRPSHPADISVETFEKVLTGIHYRRSPGRWLQRLLDSGAKSSPLLSSTQVAFWAPHLRQAFLTVTAEEQVFIRLPLQPASQSLSGILSFKENDLSMALTLSGLSGQGPRSKTKPRSSDALGGTKPTVAFLPKSAVKTSWDEGTATNLTIDMALLATLEEPVSKDGLNTPSTSDAAPRPVAPLIIPPDRPIIKLESPPSEALLEEIRSLRRELSRQKQEIERLKKRRKAP